MSLLPQVLPATGGQRRPSLRFPLLVIPLLSAVFGLVQGTAIHAVLPMALFGLFWGLAAAAVAPRLARRGARSALWADVPLALALPLAFIVLGGALLGNVLAVTPRAQLDLFAQARFGLFFYAIHGLFEWILMPLLVMVNWDRPGRRWLVVAAAVTFYLGRVASALYFAPNALAWGADPGLASLDEVQTWMGLNWARTIVQDTATGILLLLATFLPDWRRTTRAQPMASRT